jgi:hypothetical protein
MRLKRRKEIAVPKVDHSFPTFLFSFKTPSKLLHASHTLSFEYTSTLSFLRACMYRCVSCALYCASRLLFPHPLSIRPYSCAFLFGPLFLLSMLFIFHNPFAQVFFFVPSSLSFLCCHFNLCLPSPFSVCRHVLFSLCVSMAN